MSRTFAFHPAPAPVPRTRLDKLLTAPQRLAADELLSGPLYRSGEVFQRPGGSRVVRIQPARGLLDMGLASFNPETKALLATRKLLDLAGEARS